MCSACTGDYEDPNVMMEPEDEQECDDRLHLALSAAYSQLYVSTTSQIQERK